MVAHDVLTYLSAKSLEFPDIKVKITPYTYNDIDFQLYNPYYNLEYREGTSPAVSAQDPMYDETEYYADFINYHHPENDLVPGIEILSLYSAEPDWGMDQNLNLSTLQRLMGGSQGYRHMRYVLFFFIRAGVVSKQIVYFNKLSKIAFNRKDIYWGLRFSARAIHYLEDLLTPVHSKPFPESFLLKNIFSPKRLYYKSFNYHMNFEKLIGHYLWHKNPNLIKAIETSPIKNLYSLKSLYYNLKHSKIRRLLKKSFKEMDKIWGKKMGNGAYKLKESEIEDIQPNTKLLKLSAEWLNYSASVVKGYIKAFVLSELNSSMEKNDSKTI